MHRELQQAGAALVVFAAAVFAFPSPVSAQAPERFQGVVVSQQGGAAGMSSFFVEVDSYTTDAEVQEFATILARDGWEALESAWLALVDNDREKGRLSGPRFRGSDIAVARSVPHETGRIVRLATARRIGFSEARLSTRSREYAFGLIELHLDEEDKGTGTIIAAAKLEFDDDGQLRIESYGNPPISITTVEAED